MSGSLSGTEDFSSWLIEQLNIILSPLKKKLEDQQSFSELLTEHGWEIPSNIQEIQNFFPISDFNNLEHLLEQVIQSDTENVMDIYSQVFNILKNIIMRVRELADRKAHSTWESSVRYK